MAWSLSTAAVVLLILLNITVKPDHAQSGIVLSQRVVALEGKLKELESGRVCASASMQ